MDRANKDHDEPHNITHMDRDARKVDTGLMTLDLDQGMTTTSLPPLRGKFIS